jgi:hypothetical protein
VIVRPECRARLEEKGGNAVGGPSILRVVPPSHSLSLPELEAQFAPRRRIEPGERSEMAESYSALRPLYAEQSRRAQRQFADQRIKQPGCSALFHLAVESVKASRLIYGALREAESALRGGEPRVVSPEVVERAIDWNRRQLDRLAGQLQLLDLVDEVVAPLQKLFCQLEGSRHVSALGWQSIARHLLSLAGNVPQAAWLLPLPGFSLRAYLSIAGPGASGEAFARGIETVLALAPVLAVENAELTRVDSLAIAALCQDCGLLLLARRHRPGRKLETNSGRELHSSIGAALLAGISELAAEVPVLVAEHHRRLVAFDLLPDADPPTQRRASRFLATTVRFLEIVDGLTTNSIEESPQSAFYPAAIQLGREANRGEWDPSVAGELLVGLGFQVKYEPAAFGTEPDWANARRRLDPAEQAVPDPNFLSAREVPEVRHVRTTRP